MVSSSLLSTLAISEFDNPEFSDCEVHVEDRIFKVSTFTLKLHSDVFRACFRHNSVEKETGVIKIEDAPVKMVELMLRFMYSGQVENLDEEAYSLFILADRYNVVELMKLCAQSMCSNLQISTVFNCLNVAYRLNNQELRHKCIQYVADNTDKTQEQPEWITLTDQDSRISRDLCRLLNERLREKNAKVVELETQLERRAARPYPSLFGELRFDSDRRINEAARQMRVQVDQLNERMRRLQQTMADDLVVRREANNGLVPWRQPGFMLPPPPAIPIMGAEVPARLPENQEQRERRRRIMRNLAREIVFLPSDNLPNNAAPNANQDREPQRPGLERQPLELRLNENAQRRGRRYEQNAQRIYTSFERGIQQRVDNLDMLLEDARHDLNGIERRLRQHGEQNADVQNGLNLEQRVLRTRIQIYEEQLGAQRRLLDEIHRQRDEDMRLSANVERGGDAEENVQNADQPGPNAIQNRDQDQSRHGRRRNYPFDDENQPARNHRQRQRNENRDQQQERDGRVQVSNELQEGQQQFVREVREKLERERQNHLHGEQQQKQDESDSDIEIVEVEPAGEDQPGPSNRDFRPRHNKKN